MSTNETVIITETNEENSETVTEIFVTDAEGKIEESAVIVESSDGVIEAFVDENPEGLESSSDEYFLADSDSVDASAEDHATSQPTDELTEDLGTDSTFSATSTDLTELQPDVTETAADPSLESETSAADPEQTSADSHTQSAEDAQAAADQFVASGDYAAAAEARETAENEAWAAGDDASLHGSNATELSTAADNQTNAEYYEQQEATHAAAGDYEAAKEDAGNAAYATGTGDWYAGGADHTGQANAEQGQMDWASWEQSSAASDANTADVYAAQGDFDQAAVFADSANAHQASADWHGDLGEHGGEMGVYDSSSEVASGGSYDAHDTTAAADLSSYDHSSTDYGSE